MTIDWTTVLTHLLTLLVGATGGYFFKSIRVKQNINETKGKNSPIFTNKGDVRGYFGDRK
ncbi:hypothetical protein [Bhargavaea beijingensis]|uniref:hypothetical protein n=1 Tax=Bhargavaea beijingensis TaxID=426756 RepID=UPI0022258676|nr:hypothetical protein [Bhargavaea beijingensis]MCW1928364.1 hypothetical protein [Bhargavaea beijingensis]